MRNFFSWLIRREFVLRLVVFGVLANGFIIVSTTLLEVIFGHTAERLSDALFSIPLILGLTLIYLATLLKRRKHAAWLIVLPVYGFIFGLNLSQILYLAAHRRLPALALIRNIVLPAIVTGGLWAYRHEFKVKSDIQNFTLALRTSLLLLAIALGYGVLGFMLLDNHDFHQEINFPQAVHRTVDQFNITQDRELTSYSVRSRLFTDSLSIISTGAVVYVFVSLFQPFRARLSDQSAKRKLMQDLLQKYPSSSEDFFKLWPHDKNYFFNWPHSAGVAYQVYRGVALVVGDPAGKVDDFPILMQQFLEFCRLNDWLPAFIHTDGKHNLLYETNDFALQKIGEEAILNIEHFQTKVNLGKYFRQINNKFIKQGYRTEVLQPPHSQALLNRLKEVSDQWLELPGRVERGFMMGYYRDVYMQECTVMVLRDEADTIQAFMNHVPVLDSQEANYDLLRHSHAALTNSNDFLLVSFIHYLADAGFSTLNLGLCPLAGLDSKDQDRTLIDNALRFVYTNGDRFYSFSGLRRFKAKYQPEWRSRYSAYRGGLRGFSRTINALNKVMSKLR